jgi:hypothetical protein
MLHSAIHAVEWRIRLSGEVARDRLLLKPFELVPAKDEQNISISPIPQASKFRFRHRPDLVYRKSPQSMFTLLLSGLPGPSLLL